MKKRTNCRLGNSRADRRTASIFNCNFHISGLAERMSLPHVSGRRASNVDSILIRLSQSDDLYGVVRRRGNNSTPARWHPIGYLAYRAIVFFLAPCSSNMTQLSSRVPYRIPCTSDACCIASSRVVVEHPGHDIGRTDKQYHPDRGITSTGHSSPRGQAASVQIREPER
jgi:hypothetical protein